MLRRTKIIVAAAAILAANALPAVSSANAHPKHIMGSGWYGGGYWYGGCGNCGGWGSWCGPTSGFGACPSFGPSYYFDLSGYQLPYSGPYYYRYAYAAANHVAYCGKIPHLQCRNSYIRSL